MQFAGLVLAQIIDYVVTTNNRPLPASGLISTCPAAFFLATKAPAEFCHRSENILFPKILVHTIEWHAAEESQRTFDFKL